MSIPEQQQPNRYVKLPPQQRTCTDCGGEIEDSAPRCRACAAIVPYYNAEEDVAALRMAILDGGEAHYGVTTSMLAALNDRVDSDGTGAHVWLDKEYQARLLCLSWPLAQRLFRLIGLSAEGLSTDCAVTESCGNVFADLGLPDAEELLAAARRSAEAGWRDAAKRLPRFIVEACQREWDFPVPLAPWDREEE